MTATVIPLCFCRKVPCECISHPLAEIEQPARIPTEVLRGMFEMHIDPPNGPCAACELVRETIRLRKLEAACRAACVELSPDRDEAEVLTQIRALLAELAPLPEETP